MRALGASFLDDLDAMLISALVVVVVIGLAEWLQRRGVDRRLTRKIVHVGIGTWVLPTFFLFDHRLWAVIPPACFVIVNALSYRYALLQSVEGEERNVGTILYPISVATALGLFWSEEWRVVGASAVFVMAWGDAAASLVGRRFGRREYRAFGHRRTLEGSAAMLVASVAGILVCFAAFGYRIDEGVLLAALAAATAGTALEAVSVWGVDNLLVPLGAALTLSLLRGGVWA